MEISGGFGKIQPELSGTNFKEKLQAAGEKLNEGTKKVLEGFKQAGIVLTNALPTSSRSIPAKLLQTPIKFAQGFGAGFKAGKAESQQVTQKKNLNSMSDQELIAHLGKQGIGKTLQGSLNKAFSVAMESVVKNWTENKGIQDSYNDLSTMNVSESRKIAMSGFKKSEYQYDTEGRWAVDLNSLDKAGSTKFKEFDTKLQNLGFTKTPMGYFDTKTGNMFNIAYDSRNKNLTVSFWGLGNQNILQKHGLINEEQSNALGKNSTIQAGLDFFGGVTKSGLQAIEVGKLLKEATEGTDIKPMLGGHSHGGGLAQCAALATGLQATVFNPRPMGAGMRRYIGQDKIAENSKNITGFSVKGDFLTDNKLLNALAITMEKVTGIIAPRNIGNFYKVPTLTPDSKNSPWPPITSDKALNHCAFNEALLNAS